MKEYFTYIMSNPNQTLYIGVTNDLVRRVYEHKEGLNPGFTAKYKLHDLVHFEIFNDINAAIHREKQLKRYLRQWKLDLIATTNPEFKDLYSEILGSSPRMTNEGAWDKSQNDATPPLSPSGLTRGSKEKVFLEAIPADPTAKVSLVDTHAHIHQDSYEADRAEMLERAAAAGVGKIICVGTGGDDSQLAVQLARPHDNLWATVGLHPHDAKLSDSELEAIKALAADPKVVAIGECGLDYFYNHSPKADQLRSFKAQVELALEVEKPLVFHVREAFDDFFGVLAEYKNVTGVVHCFTGDTATLNKVLDHGFYVAYNGIMTFTKDQAQLEAAKACPQDRLLLETDCPYLTPAPHRGQRNEPANVKVIAEFLAELRGETFDKLAAATTKNAETLFGL